VQTDKRVLKYEQLKSGLTLWPPCSFVPICFQWYVVVNIHSIISTVY